MNKSLSLLALLLLLLGGCKKAVDLLPLTFTVDDSSTVQVPASGPLTGVLLTLPGFTVNSTANATFAANKTAANYVQDVTLNRLNLTVTNPTTQNFDFLKRVEIYIAADAAGTNKILLAALNPVPTGQTTLALTPTDAKLDSYLRGSSYALFVTAEQAKPLLQNTTLRIDSQFRVRATLP